MFEVKTLSNLTKEQKELIKTNMLNTLELESTTYEGFEVIIDIQDQIIVTIKANLVKADKKILQKVGLDFSNINMNLKSAISSFKNDGYTCN